jgi:ribosomal protein S18 acetylase RimI-like enzyme
MSLSIRPAGEAALRRPALTFLYHRLPRGERERQLAQTLTAVDRGEISLENLLVATEFERIVGVVLAVRRPGGAAFLWPPVVIDGPTGFSAAQSLLEEIAQRADRQEVVFTQCLLDPSDDHGRAVLTRGGIPRITELILLSRSLPGKQAGHSDLGLTFDCYSGAAHADFARVVEETYQGSLDCPALARIRSGEQLLESHRATETFHPTLCRLYRLAGREIGIVLLAEHRDRNVWEVAYLGVVPAARGRGFGRALLSSTIDQVRESGRDAIEIAVDCENTPAIRLYDALGFEEQRRFAVHLRFRPSS